MITPYKNEKVDYGAVAELTEWYIENGCSGIFAVCQSSEMFYLTLEEKVKISETVVKTANGRLTVVASGHTADEIERQAYELNMIADTGIDALILVTNRLDINDEGQKVWFSNAEKLLGLLNDDVALGFYECPKPYKKLLTPEMIRLCAENERFRFIKDTCCSLETLSDRLDRLKDSRVMLFNANGQTLLESLKKGAAGYSGVMANFCPDLFVKLCNDPAGPKAEALADALSLLSFTEDSFYPMTAKYYLKLCGLSIGEESRSCGNRQFGSYQKMWVEQLYRYINKLREETL